MKELIEKSAQTILNLYGLPALYFSTKGESWEMPEEVKLSSKDDQYKWLFVSLLGEDDNGFGCINHPMEKSSYTSICGSKLNNRYYRRSLEDMFLLSKHYINNPSVFDIAAASKRLLSSNFCFSTGLRVYRNAGYYDGHNTCESDDKKKRGLLSSLWWYDEDEVLPSHLVNDYNELIEVIRLAEECAKQHPNFVAVGRGFQKKESTQ